MSARRICFCRSGGGLPGLDIHAGIWQALNASGIHATACHGTSAGAIISALDAAEWDSHSTEMLIRSFCNDDVIDYRFLWELRIGWMANICSGDAVLRRLDGIMPRTFDALTKPCSAWATQAETSRLINAMRPTIATCPAQAVAMSSRIPAVFPPIIGVDGLPYVDGGMRNNLPLPADWRDYDDVYLLIASGAPSDTDPAGTVLGNLLDVFHHLMADQILDVLDEVQGASNVHVIWPRLETPSMLCFDHNLIDLAFTETLKQLAA